ncbi:MAG: DoxX family membrane protein [Ignavibacteriae bacterium]|nr:DoxX family membrane protein [Ignavibacteriota bacterium]
MKNLQHIGQIFFGVALLCLGVEHFIFQDFITGRAPAWPESMPGKLVWAYLTGIAFIAAGAAIFTSKKVRVAAMSTGALIFLWALLRHLPVIATDSFLSGAWTKAGKALVFWSAAWAVAATAPKMESARRGFVLKFINLEYEFVILNRICLGIFFLMAGIQHFMYIEFVTSLIPTWFPGDPVFWTRLAGIALLAGGVGLIIPQTARWASLLSGLMVFSWFWIVHIPRTFTSVSDGIAVFEALAVTGIAFVLAGYLSKFQTKTERL